VFYHIIGDNASFLQFLAPKLSPCGCPVQILPGYRTETAEIGAADLANRALHAAPGIYLLGGEMPVTVRGSGAGGRCTHFALCFAKAISGRAEIELIAIASDGNDNLTASAGAMVNGNSWTELAVQGIDGDLAIAANDSFTALSAIHAIIPGFPSGLNINDVLLLCCSPCASRVPTRASRGDHEGITSD
jgi:hydroxypyruvate reductase